MNVGIGSWVSRSTPTLDADLIPSVFQAPRLGEFPHHPLLLFRELLGHHDVGFDDQMAALIALLNEPGADAR